MIVRRFLRFIRTANAIDRAAGARALARAFLVSDLSDGEREEARSAMTVLLDDVSPAVRRALAEVLAGSAEAPRHVVLSLAADQADIAAVVIARSPVLLDSELIDIVANGDLRVQRAVAERRPLAMPVAAALAEVGLPEAACALLGNDRAEVAVFSLARLADRLGDDAAVRAALLARADLPAGTRQRLVHQLSQALRGFVVGRAWLGESRAAEVVEDALEHATLALAEEGDPSALADLVAQLAESGGLTPALILHALCLGNWAFLEEAIVRLTGTARGRVSAVVHGGSPHAFRALYRRAGLPDGAYAAFQTALDVVMSPDLAVRDPADPAFSRRVVERVLTRYEAFAEGSSDHLLLLLRRFSAEAARAEARQFAAAVVAMPSAPLLLAAPIAA